MTRRWMVRLSCLGLPASLSAGCSGPANQTGAADVDAGGAPEGPESGSDSDASGGADAGSGTDSGADSSTTSGTDSGAYSGTDSGAYSGVGDSGAEPGTDSGTAVIFGDTCPTGTTYTDPFTSDSVASGTWTYLAGSYIVNTASQTLTLDNGAGGNGQLWIGARPNWTNYTVAVPITIGSSGNAGLNFRMEDVPNPAPNDSGDMYYAGIQEASVELGVESGGSTGSKYTSLDSASGAFAPGTPYNFQVSVSGNTINVSVDGKFYVQSWTDGTYTFGSIGLRAYDTLATYGPVTVTCN